MRKLNIKTEDGSVSAKMAIAVAVCVIVFGSIINMFAECDTSPASGQKCTAKSTTTTGNCTGSCPSSCGGGKNQTQYNGCYECTTGSNGDAYHDPDTCNQISGNSTTRSDCVNCEFKTRNASCTCVSFTCDVPANGWPSWPTQYSICPNCNSCQ